MKMRYFSFLMFLMLGVYAFAQKDVTQFLGIPVDGTKTEMVQKLKAKGFKYKIALMIGWKGSLMAVRLSCLLLPIIIRCGVLR